MQNLPFLKSVKNIAQVIHFTPSLSSVHSLVQTLDSRLDQIYSRQQTQQFRTHYNYVAIGHKQVAQERNYGPLQNADAQQKLFLINSRRACQILVSQISLLSYVVTNYKSNVPISELYDNIFPKKKKINLQFSSLPILHGPHLFYQAGWLRLGLWPLN